MATGNDFIELIQFADNEGVIGTTVSGKLLSDFNKYEEDAKMFSQDDWFYRKYCDWKHAFAIASQNGCVRFH